MIENFISLYRQVLIDPPAELLKSRWEQLETFMEDWDSDQVIGAVRLIKDLPAELFSNSLNKFFKEKDPTFPIGGNPRELEVLSSAALFGLLKTDSNHSVSDFAALLVRATFMNGAKSNLAKALAKEARNYIKSRSIDFYDSVRVKKIERKHIGAEKLPDAYDTKTAEILLKKMRSVDASFDGLQMSHDFEKEKNNILWWLFTGFSHDVDQHYGKSPESECLLAGKELADLIVNIPGLYAPEMALGKVAGLGSIKKNEPKELSFFIESCQPEWVKRCGPKIAASMGEKRSELKDLLICAYGMVLTGEGAKPGPWFKSIGKQNETVVAKLNPLEASIQFYSECLVLRALDLERENV